MELIHFQNANSGNDTVVNNFVVRQKEFNRVMDDIRTTKKDSSYHHYVFIGRRGSGKSTLLRRIQAEITIDKTLSKHFEVVNLSEEQSGIYKLYDLWDYVIRALNAIGYAIADIDFRLYKHNMKEYTKVLHGEVIKALKFKKKRLVLLIDNIDRVLESKVDDNDAALLRELLMNFNEIRIIGCSTVMSEEFWKYDKPFYEFFTIKRLEKLSLEEMKLLLNHWSDAKQLPQIKENIDKYPGKLQSIRMLTDGMPRTMLLFIDMLLNRPAQNGFEYLQYIVDKATPIYQERLAQLSPAQNKVITELAFFWDAAGVDQLIPKCKMDGKTISAILSQLVQLRYVEKIKGETKNLLYRIEERFFNLWFNMTQGGPQQKLEARALTNFLEVWYNKPELEKLCYELADSVKSGGMKQDYAESMTAALLHSNYLDAKAKLNLYNEVNESGVVDMEKFGDSELYLDNIGAKIAKEINSGNFENANRIVQLSGLSEMEKHFYFGLCNEDAGNLFEAEKHYAISANLGNVKAMNNIALIYKKQCKFDKEEKFLKLASNKGSGIAMFNYASLLANKHEMKQAIKWYEKSIQKGQFDAINNLALLYKKQGDLVLAEKLLLEGVKLDLIYASYNLSNLYFHLHRPDEAVYYCKIAIEKNDAKALNNLLVYYYIANEKASINELLNNIPDSLIKKFESMNVSFSLVLFLYLGNMEKFEMLSYCASELELKYPTLNDLVVFNQITWVINYFNNHPSTIEQYKSLYYASLILGGNNQNEILKMPPEIAENVQDIITKIKKLRQFYFPDEM